MKYCRAQALLAFIVVLLMSTAPAIFSETVVGLQTKITRTKAGLLDAKQSRSQLLEQLQLIEKRRGKMTLKAKASKQQLDKQQRQLRQLQNQRAQFRDDLTEQQRLFDLQLQQAYVLYRQPAIKLLLDQASSGAIERMVTYHTYIDAKLAVQMRTIEGLMQHLHHNQRRLATEHQALQRLRHHRSQQLHDLGDEQQRRHQLVKKLDAKITNQQQRLALYQSNKKRLERTLRYLRRAKVFSSGRGFARLKGRLAWPTKGTVAHLFGQRIARSELHWEGTLISAPSGQSVAAIAPGQVVFAKWLSGYGLMVIINHGGGYMSMYGRNQNVFTKVGDRVKAGEVIASVGNTGGFNKTALYFAIRHNAQPLNPRRWCR